MKYPLLIISVVFITGAIACGGSNGNDRQFEPGRIIAIAEKEGNDQLIKVGGGPGSVPPGSTVTVTNMRTMESKSTAALPDGSFDPEFRASTGDLFRIEISDEGQPVEEMTIGVTLLTDIVQNNLGTLGDVPSAIEIRSGIAYVVNGFSDNIQRFDLTQTPPSELPSVATPTGSDPVAIEFAGDNKAYTANMIGQSVSLVDLETGECELLYARQQPAEDPGCGETIILQDAFEDPSDVILIGEKLYVSNNNFDEFFFPDGNGFITVIDTGTNQISSFIESDGANSGNMKLSGNDLYVLNTGNFIFDSETGEFQCDPDFPPSVTIIDPETDAIADSVDIELSAENPLVCAPGSMSITPDNNFAYLGLSLVGGMLKLDIQNGTVLRGTSNPVAFTDLSGLNSVTDIGFNSRGLGFATLFNTDQIAVFDTETDEQNRFPFIAPIPAGIKALNPDSEFFDGVQFIDFREENVAGPDLYFITTLSTRLGSVDTKLLTQ